MTVRPVGRQQLAKTGEPKIKLQMSCDREFRESCRSRGRLNDHGIMPFIREAPRVVGLRNSAVPGRIEHHRATYLEVGAGGENELEIKCCDNPRFFCRRTA